MSRGLGIGAGLDGCISPSLSGGLGHGNVVIEAFLSRDWRKLEAGDDNLELNGVSKILDGGEP